MEVKNMDVSDFLQKNKLVSMLIVIMAVAAIIFLSYILSTASTRIVPSKFADARVTAAQHAADVVGMLAVTNGRIREVEQLVREGRKSDALTIVTEEIEKSKDIREKALQLSVELEKMVESIPAIHSDEASRIALVATTKETQLISRLIAYTEELQDLLTDLSFAVTQPWPDYGDVNDSISDSNEIADEVNALNEEYKKEMEGFDTLVEEEEKKK